MTPLGRTEEKKWRDNFNCCCQCKKRLNWEMQDHAILAPTHSMTIVAGWTMIQLFHTWLAVSVAGSRLRRRCCPDDWWTRNEEKKSLLPPRSAIFFPASSPVQQLLEYAEETNGVTGESRRNTRLEWKTEREGMEHQIRRERKRMMEKKTSVW